LGHWRCILTYMITITVVGILVALAALIWYGNRQMGVVLHTIGEIQPPDTPSESILQAQSDGLHDRNIAMEDCMQLLTQAVADGIDHVDRNEKRVRGIVTGAKRRFEAAGFIDPGVEAEIDTLPELNGQLSVAEELSAVPEDLGATGPPAGVPGVVPAEFWEN